MYKNDSIHVTVIIDVNTPETWEALSTIRGEAELVAYMLIPPSRIGGSGAGVAGEGVGRVVMGGTWTCRGGGG